MHWSQFFGDVLASLMAVALLFCVWSRLVGDILASLVAVALLSYVCMLVAMYPAIEVEGHGPLSPWPFIRHIALYTALIWAWLFIRGQLP